MLPNMRPPCPPFYYGMLVNTGNCLITITDVWTRCSSLLLKTDWHFQTASPCCIEQLEEGRDAGYEVYWCAYYKRYNDQTVICLTADTCDYKSNWMWFKSYQDLTNLSKSHDAIRDKWDPKWHHLFFFLQKIVTKLFPDRTTWFSLLGKYQVTEVK